MPVASSSAHPPQLVGIENTVLNDALLYAEKMRNFTEPYIKMAEDTMELANGVEGMIMDSLRGEKALGKNDKYSNRS